MNYSVIGLQILAAQEVGMIKTNNDFWKNFSDKTFFEKSFDANERAKTRYQELQKEFDTDSNQLGIVCFFDEDFPVINKCVKNNSEKPYLFIYKGNLSLLKNLNNNVAVIGLTDPDENIVNREKSIIEQLVNHDITIVSGLAKGCDSIAHQECLKLGGKTIAILPSTLSDIFPKENKLLAEEIVKNNGLLITEYYKDSVGRYDAIKRFVERDRLQTMFSKAVILIASYRYKEGDSGSRHAMEAANKYEVNRYVMFNPDLDKFNIKFGLNSDYARGISSDNKVIPPVEIITSNSIKEIVNIKNSNLYNKLVQDVLF